MRSLRRLKTLGAFSSLSLLIIISGFSHAKEVIQELDVQRLLNAFIEDYIENDTLPETPIAFGLQITSPRDEKWTISIDSTAAEKVTLTEGFPEDPTFFFVTDYPTLKKIHDVEINALTAAGRARMTDKTPLDFGFMPGFQASPDFISSVMLPLGFHFFTRGKPEIIPFGEKYSRFVHGGNAVIFYYEKGLRTSWYQVKKGMKINDNLEDATNPFPSLFIFTKGEGQALVDHKKITVKEGMSIFVQAGMIHQFWTESDSGLEFVLIMFGKDA